jgi:hypothetical protein
MGQPLPYYCSSNRILRKTCNQTTDQVVPNSTIPSNNFAGTTPRCFALHGEFQSSHDGTKFSQERTRWLARPSCVAVLLLDDAGVLKCPEKFDHLMLALYNCHTYPTHTLIVRRYANPSMLSNTTIWSGCKLLCTACAWHLGDPGATNCDNK